MASNFITLNNYMDKFYQKEINSKRFSELSEERLAALSKKVYREQEMMTNDLMQLSGTLSKVEKYRLTLQYLTNPRINLDLRTFDERMAFLIMMIDPNLVTFKEFLKADIISLAEIAKVADEKEKNNLKKIRSYSISSYESIVREKVGIYDVKLLKYEEMFFKKFFGEKELITEIGSKHQNNLVVKARLLKDFNSVTDERYSELVNIAQTWVSLTSKQFNSNGAAYTIANQKKLLGLNNLEEQFTLFILLADANLDMLKIYEEESKMQIIEERIVEEFGYFNKELLVLERKFHDRFCPDKKLSVWTKIKKASKL